LCPSTTHLLATVSLIHLRCHAIVKLLNNDTEHHPCTIESDTDPGRNPHHIHHGARSHEVSEVSYASIDEYYEVLTNDTI
jgi:hypothetical protein